MGDLKIHDISYLPDPCALPEVIKKRSLIEKEKLIYAPFSGVGGIVYDKDAVYVELGGSHSHKADADVDDETNLMVSNLIETKQTLDMKMKHSEMQIFTGGKKLTASDVKQKYQKIEPESITNNFPKQTVDSDLEDELDQLRNKKDYSELKEEKVVDSGRTRRKVVFDQNDDDFTEAIKTNDDSSGDSDSDDGFEQNKNTVYTVLKENKDKGIHDKVANALKYLDNKTGKNTAPTADLNDESSSADESGEEEELDEEESDVPDDISLDSNESLVGVAKMKRKANIIDVADVKKADKISKNKNTSANNLKSKEINTNKTKNSTSDTSEDDFDDDSESDNESVENKSSEKDEDNSDEESDDDSAQEQEESESDGDNEEYMSVKWKENLGKKARDAFLDRQRSTQNIMRLVYGK